jgi:hypothetical protein
VLVVAVVAVVVVVVAVVVVVVVVVEFTVCNRRFCVHHRLTLGKQL